MSRILKWIKDEILHVFPAVVFFFVAFNIINLTTELMVKKQGISIIITLPTITIGALVVGKVLLVIDNLPFINAFSNKPLVYNTLWKTFIYSLAGLAYRFIDKLVPFISTYKKPALAYRHFMDEMDWSRFWAIQIWVIVLLLIFVLTREFIQAMGGREVRRMFFGR